uniref:Uncharacterized protein n=2 Tax=unclassified Caudoviricetes TaxID=2788787 RepID=A0A8S5NAG2_9CAUD|nr:MAG TPA: hypothetical protein [Siphoviridae sp. ctCOj19]DAD91641.1 MAG TPA: hypothetical protein [Siphoviridae sp. ctjd446]
MTLQTYSANRGQDKAKAQRITTNGREFSLPFFFVSKYQVKRLLFCFKIRNFVSNNNLQK